MSDENAENIFKNWTVLLKLMDLLKLVRFLRVKAIIDSSNVIRDLQQKRKSFILLMIKYVYLIILTSHWFACIWCFTAFAQVSTFSEDELSKKPNWIAYWHSNNYADGGLNPFGWKNDLNR